MSLHLHALLAGNLPPEALWELLDGRLQAHAARCGRIPFPILDFTTVKWTYSRGRVLDYLQRQCPPRHEVH